MTRLSTAQLLALILSAAGAAAHAHAPTAPAAVSGIDPNTFIVQPPSSVRWPAESEAEGPLRVAARAR